VGLRWGRDMDTGGCSQWSGRRSRAATPCWPHCVSHAVSATGPPHSRAEGHAPWCPAADGGSRSLAVRACPGRRWSPLYPSSTNMTANGGRSLGGRLLCLLQWRGEHTHTVGHAHGHKHDAQPPRHMKATLQELVNRRHAKPPATGGGCSRHTPVPTRGAVLTKPVLVVQAVLLLRVRHVAVLAVLKVT
jgi:hypothetical protein